MSYQEGILNQANYVVLHVVLDANGGQPQFENLVVGLKKKGFQQVVCSLSSVTPCNNFFENIGIDVIHLGYNKKDLRKIRFSIIKKIKKIISDYKVNIVHGQRHKSTFYGTLAAWWAGSNVRAVTTVHGQNRTRNLKRKLTNFFVFNRVDLIFGVSQTVCQDILITNKNLSADKVFCIYNGIDAERFTQPNVTRKIMRQRLKIDCKDAVIIGTIGRLTPIKGHQYLVEAFFELSKRYDKLHLVIWGEGGERNRLEQLLEQKKIRERVRLPGFTDDVSSCLHSLDIFVMPSLSEGHPLALLEAMAAGLPIVATNVGGIPEIITSKEEGVLVSSKNTKQLIYALEKQLNKLPHEHIANSRALQLKVNELYPISSMVDQIAAYYSSLLNPEASVWQN